VHVQLAPVRVDELGKGVAITSACPDEQVRVATPSSIAVSHVGLSAVTTY
jgi:hypothetical protein